MSIKQYFLAGFMYHINPKHWVGCLVWSLTALSTVLSHVKQVNLLNHTFSWAGLVL